MACRGKKNRKSCFKGLPEALEDNLMPKMCEHTPDATRAQLQLCLESTDWTSGDLH